MAGGETYPDALRAGSRALLDIEPVISGRAAALLSRGNELLPHLPPPPDGTLGVEILSTSDRGNDDALLDGRAVASPQGVISDLIDQFSGTTHTLGEFARRLADSMIELARDAELTDREVGDLFLAVVRDSPAVQPHGKRDAGSA